MEINCLCEIPRILHFLLKGNKKTVTNFQIPQNKMDMRFYGKLSQDHEFSEEIFFIQTIDPRNLKKRLKNPVFYNFPTSDRNIAHFGILSKFRTK